MKPVAQISIAPPAKPCAHGIIDALDRRFCGQACANGIAYAAQPAAIIGEHAIGFQNL